MKIVIFGLSVSSSWGNGHATLWRGLCRALGERGHRVVFFERDVQYYASHRDLAVLPGGKLCLYASWLDVLKSAQRQLSDADVAMVTSFCPDGIAASDAVLASRARLRVFYDLDTPVTLERVKSGLPIEYIGANGLAGFDLVLSYTGGNALLELKQRLGARRAVPLYGSVDPLTHHPVEPFADYRSDLSYLGTYAPDRQERLERLLVETARRAKDRKFLIAGPLYPRDFPWQENIFHLEHLPPTEHPRFFCSSRLTLNVTRGVMAQMGYCPSGRLFEAAACGVPIVSDEWPGLEEFFEPGREILIARSTEEVLGALALPAERLKEISRAARERVLGCHTAEKRAEHLIEVLEKAGSGLPASQTSGKPDARPPELVSERCVWGIVPAAGIGSRIQPLAFSKELLPVGSRIDNGTERPRAVGEYLMERMVRGGADRICFVISAGKSDILSYFGGEYGTAKVCYGVQPRPAGLCDAIFTALPMIGREDLVLIGLPDTIWFPEDGFSFLREDALSMLLFPVAKPELFDAVVPDSDGNVLEIRVKQPQPGSSWIWGAIKMPGRVLHELYALWRERGKQDEYMGTLINAYIALGRGPVKGVKAGQAYVDVGTLHGYREALQVLELKLQKGGGWLNETYPEKNQVA